MNTNNAAKNEALAQLKAAFEACEAAGLTVVALAGDTAHEVGFSGLDTVEGEPVAVLWLDESRGLDLDLADEGDLVEDVEAICEKWLRGLGRDKDNAWPNALAELDDLYCNGTDLYSTAVDLARNYFQAV